MIPVKRPDDHAEIYLVGGGIASLAAAVFVIGDGVVHDRHVPPPLRLHSVARFSELNWS